MSYLLKEDFFFAYQEKKSRFLVYAYQAFSKEEAFKHIEEIRALNPKADHLLYVFKAQAGQEGANDDKEPSSAAKKALSFLTERGIDNTVMIIVRYFGGTKLGAGRLAKVYLDLFLLPLKEANLQLERKNLRYEASLYVKETDYLLGKIIQAGGKIEKKDFNGQKLNLIFSLPEGEEALLSAFISYRILN